MKNLIIRTISGIAFIIIMIGSILWGVLPYAVIMALIMILMMNEYMNISLGKKYILQKTLATISGVLLFTLVLLVELDCIGVEYIIFSLLPVIFIFISTLYVREFNIHKFSEEDGEEKRTANGFELLPFTLGSILYIAVPISMCHLIVLDGSAGQVQYCGATLLSMFIILWATDVGAYCLGSTLGQRFGKKLFPSISPKKSWIGFAGGVGCAILAAVLLHFANLLSIGLLQSVVLGIIISIFGVWGDLIESQFKRNFGVKDSGKIMPGHGGMLDRFDGAIIAFPVAVIYLKFFL